MEISLLEMPNFGSTLELVFKLVFGQIFKPIFEPIFEPFYNSIELGPCTS